MADRGTHLNRSASECTKKNLCSMTKVILGGSDEGGGCTEPKAKIADRFKRTESDASGEQLASASEKGATFHGPRCIEQSVSDLRGEQSEQHEQQLADSSAAVVVGFAHQLRCGRRRRPFSGERSAGQLQGPRTIGHQRH